MSESAQARGGTDGSPVPPAGFRSAPSGGDAAASPGGRPGDAPPAPPTPAPDTAAETAARTGPRITGAVQEPSAPKAAEEALDRPGRPVLAGAAIAGLLMVVAPFAMTAGVPGVTLESVPLASGADVTGGRAPGAAEAGAAGSTESGASVAQAGTGSAPPQGDPAQETGYVPEVSGGEGAAPAMPDPGTAAASGDAPVETAPAEREAPETATAPEEGETSTGDPAAEDASTDGGAGNGADAEAGGAGADGGDAETGDAGTDAGDGVAGAPEEGADGTAQEDGGTGASQEDGSAENAEPPGSETAGQEDSGQGSAADGNAAADTPPQTEGTGTGDASDAAGTAAQGQAAEPRITEGRSGTEPQPSEGGGSILEDAVATTGAPEPEPFLAVAGPGCPDTPGSSYANAERWDSAEGTGSWATRPGGYAQEGCDGGYEAVPVSGDPERGNGQYASWTFSPGEAGAVCELYVHVPDDESPLWIAPGEARYQIFPGPAAEGSAAAVFGFDQAGVRGGWVQVTGFTSPTEEFTVQLTNAGADPLAGQEHTSAHVAASAVRASCS
ncbi:hypothetical protein [Nocardiopsis quinghaiensis]|uniref:hypothetical protein n=1 Tax=Nocardiopsis quinghaiensis TaxID=464995 RepID=UPI001239572C|nr:hypothetical protein [Nocardiopsis quinghaiensis]